MADEYWYHTCLGCAFATGTHWHLFRLSEYGITERIFQQTKDGNLIAWFPE